MSQPSPPLDREAKRRLAVIRHVEEVTGNVAMTCRYFGISRQAYYIWYRRYQAEGIDGLRTRSKRPSPARTPPTSRLSERSSTCGRTTTSGPRRSPCT
ncbi:helix-turn-helix domain-containing protein [Nonomuraea polychroma]|uniref:helix-turn-helix domain-containing protein n=1 Tax=Nonomuraea polychroma TaxID=46176 RepID=UPI003D8E8B12